MSKPISPWLASQRALAGEGNGYPSLAQVFGRAEPVDQETKDGEFLDSIRKGAGQAVRDYEAKLQSQREYVGGYQRPWPKPIGEAANDPEIEASHGVPQPEDLPSEVGSVMSGQLENPHDHPHDGMRSLLKAAAEKATAMCPMSPEANMSLSGARHMHRYASEAHGAALDHAQQLGRNDDAQYHMQMQQYHKDAATWIGQHTAHRFESAPEVTANSAPYVRGFKRKPLVENRPAQRVEEPVSEVDAPPPFRFQSW